MSMCISTSMLIFKSILTPILICVELCICLFAGLRYPADVCPIPPANPAGCVLSSNHGFGQFSQDAGLTVSGLGLFERPYS